MRSCGDSVRVPPDEDKGRFQEQQNLTDFLLQAKLKLKECFNRTRLETWNEDGTSIPLLPRYTRHGGIVWQAPIEATCGSRSAVLKDRVGPLIRSRQKFSAECSAMTVRTANALATKEYEVPHTAI